MNYLFKQKQCTTTRLARSPFAYNGAEKFPSLTFLGSSFGGLHKKPKVGNTTDELTLA